MQLNNLKKEYSEKEEDLKDEILSLTNKLKSANTDNIIKQNEIINLQSELERLRVEFSQMKEDKKSQQQKIDNQQTIIEKQQDELDQKEVIHLDKINSGNQQEEQEIEHQTNAQKDPLKEFKVDMSSFSFEDNLDFSTERLKILTHQTEILLNLNKHLDKDSIIYTNNQEHSTIEDFKKKFPDQSTIEVLQNTNIQLKSYNQNISTLVEQTNNLIKVDLLINRKMTLLLLMWKRRCL